MKITKKMAEEITDMANLNQLIQDKIWSYMKLPKQHRDCVLLADNIIMEVKSVIKKDLKEILKECNDDFNKDTDLLMFEKKILYYMDKL